jgi:Flp pilus assembly protein TadB
MDQNKIQQDIAIIKDMIAKTRKETAQSGLIFVIPGILLIIFVIAIYFLEKMNLQHLFLPILITTVIIIGIVSFIIALKFDAKERVKTYPRMIFGQLWIACGASCIITGLIFPLLKVYSWNIIVPACWPIIAIGFYLTGIVFEIPLVRWCSLFWWLGAFLMVLTPNSYHLTIVISTLVLGYILPGFILNRKYNSRSKTNEARSNS